MTLQAGCARWTTDLNTQMMVHLRSRSRCQGSMSSDTPSPAFVNVGDRLYLANRLERLRTKPSFALASDDERWVNEIHLEAQTELSHPDWAATLAGYGASLAVDLMIQALQTATHPVQILFSLESSDQSNPSGGHTTGSLNAHQVRGPVDDLSRTLGDMEPPVMVLTSGHA